MKKANIVYEEKEVPNYPIGKSNGDTRVLNMTFVRKRIEYPLFRIHQYFWDNVLSEETKSKLQEELRQGIMKEE